ncbi:DUF6148 family protein [Clostridium butyricum]
MAFNIETCREHLDAWLKAELAVCNGQSYSIAGRTLTRANLSSIRAQIDYWKSELAKANNIEKRRGRNRVFRIVPRDL